MALTFRQLGLPFPQADYYRPQDFLPDDSNAEARAWLAEPRRWPHHRLALHGDHGTGKTHLLHVFAASHGATLLQGGAIRHLPAAPDAPLAIDDADDAADPRALLHLLNAAAERRLPVVLACTVPPARWPGVLPDLDSRLRATIAVGIGQPGDALLRALLARLIADRQLRVDPSVHEYLIARLPRSCQAMREAAARLDRASLAIGRRVTRPLAAGVLAGLEGDEAGWGA